MIHLESVHTYSFCSSLRMQLYFLWNVFGFLHNKKAQWTKMKREGEFHLQNSNKIEKKKIAA